MVSKSSFYQLTSYTIKLSTLFFNNLPDTFLNFSNFLRTDNNDLLKLYLYQRMNKYLNNNLLLLLKINWSFIGNLVACLIWHTSLVHSASNCAMLTGRFAWLHRLSLWSVKHTADGGESVQKWDRNSLSMSISQRSRDGVSLGRLFCGKLSTGCWEIGSELEMSGTLLRVGSKSLWSFFF